jgi:saccharopine dehydrogenase-like NADP-dependent oxidoreductase
MNEIGVDPGVDHLYALKTINEVHAEGGKVHSPFNVDVYGSMNGGRDFILQPKDMAEGHF